MKVDILICSWYKDIPYLEMCLQSIRRFASGFGDVRLLVALEEVPEFMPIASEFQTDLCHYNRDQHPVKWHLHHQAMKCNADKFCINADFILHTDSDCIFTESVSPRDYFVDGKPELLVQSYETCGGERQWKGPTERALGFSCSHETMRRHPAVHYRGMYKEMRECVELVHKMPFDEYVLSCKPDFPWGFSEFNALGSFVLNSHWAEKYHIIDTGAVGHPPSSKKLVQFWSHSPKNQPQSTPWGLNMTPEKAFNKLLK